MGWVCRCHHGWVHYTCQSRKQAFKHTLLKTMTSCWEKTLILDPAAIREVTFEGTSTAVLTFELWCFQLDLDIVGCLSRSIHHYTVLHVSLLPPSPPLIPRHGHILQRPRENHHHHIKPVMLKYYNGCTMCKGEKTCSWKALLDANLPVSFHVFLIDSRVKAEPVFSMGH